jgi:hypothetical protein
VRLKGGWKREGGVWDWSNAGGAEDVCRFLFKDGGLGFTCIWRTLGL